jgi:hypothetical protein
MESTTFSIIVWFKQLVVATGIYEKPSISLHGLGI